MNAAALLFAAAAVITDARRFGSAVPWVIFYTRIAGRVRVAEARTVEARSAEKAIRAFLRLQREPEAIEVLRVWCEAPVSPRAPIAALCPPRLRFTVRGSPWVLDVYSEPNGRRSIRASSPIPDPRTGKTPERAISAVVIEEMASCNAQVTDLLYLLQIADRDRTIDDVAAALAAGAVLSAGPRHPSSGRGRVTAYRTGGGRYTIEPCDRACFADAHTIARLWVYLVGTVRARWELITLDLRAEQEAAAVEAAPETERVPDSQRGRR